MRMESLVAVCLLVACITLTGSIVLGNEDNLGYVPGELIVRTTGDASLMDLFNQFGGKGMRVQKVFDGKTNLMHVKLPDGVSVHQALDRYRYSKSVMYVEPNYTYELLATPNDTSFKKLWGMKNIQAEAAWEYTTGSRNITVAVIDTGVDYTHPDLAENAWVNSGEIPGNGVDDDMNGYVDDVYGWDFANGDNDPLDDHYHGTHCAGTIGGVGNNGMGVAGVNWNVKIMALKFFKKNGQATLAGAIGAIDYAVRNGAHVASNSWGGSNYSQAMGDAIAAAGEKGLIFVAAAGNHSGNNDLRPVYPAGYQSPNVIAVAASGSNDALSSFSCFGRISVDLAAPGAGIYSTAPDNKYKNLSGTSMATPHVAGAVALVLSVFPGLTPAQMKELLMATTDEVPAYRGKIASMGRLNLYNAVTNTRPDRSEPADDKWAEVDKVVESDHNYPNSSKLKYTISHPGASRIRVHFERIATETNYDTIVITDVNNQEVDRFSGQILSMWSYSVPGDTAHVWLISDRSTNDWGFKIDAYGIIP